MIKKIVIFGASGLIGSELQNYLKSKYKVEPLSGKVLYESPEKISAYLNKTNIVINLSGQNIAGRWTKKVKSKIENSRIITTGNLVKSFRFLKEKPDLFINASGIGIYAEGNIMDETSTDFADNFLARLVINWENEALKAEEMKIKTVLMRLGIVLSKNGGAYKKLRNIIKLYVGGITGTGKQSMSFIHIIDLLRAVGFIIENKLEGIINMCTPNPTSNKEFIKLLASEIKRPAIFPIPECLLRIILLEGHIVVTKGQKGFPSVLLKKGFNFLYPDVYKCIQNLEE